MKLVVNLFLLAFGGTVGTLAAIQAHNNLEAQLIGGAIGMAVFALALSWWYIERTRSE